MTDKIQLDKLENAICELAEKVNDALKALHTSIDLLNARIEREGEDNWEYHAAITKKLEELSKK